MTLWLQVSCLARASWPSPLSCLCRSSYTRGLVYGVSTASDFRIPLGPSCLNYGSQLHEGGTVKGLQWPKINSKSNAQCTQNSLAALSCHTVWLHCSASSEHTASSHYTQPMEQYLKPLSSLLFLKKHNGLVTENNSLLMSSYQHSSKYK